MMFEKLREDVVIPTRSTRGSVGYDLTATHYEWDDAKTKVTYFTGIRIKDIPEGYFPALFPRSSIVNFDARLANSVGVIDCDYEGEIKVVFDVPLVASQVISPGNARLMPAGSAVAQLVFIPYATDGKIVDVERGTGGFGSTSKKKGATKDGRQDAE